MKKKELPKSICLTIHPKFTEGETFQWALLNNPRFVKADDDAIVLAFVPEEQKLENSTSIQFMRLFACSIVRDILRKEGRISESVNSDFKFEIPEADRNSSAEVLEKLFVTLINDIIYQTDPLKPTKSKLDSLSLTSKQEQSTQNIENEQERIETSEQ